MNAGARIEGGEPVLRLGAWDTLFLVTETAAVHHQTLKVAILDASAPVDIEAVRRAVARATVTLPPLRYRMHDVPFGFHRPLWLERAALDVDRHVHAGRLPAPGGRRELEALVGRLASTQVDRGRPLWELHVVDGLADGRVAAIAKIHHALADGVACHNLLLLAATALRRPGVDAGPPADRVPSLPQLARLAIGEHARQARELPSLAGRTVKGVRARRRLLRTPPPGLARPNEAPPMFWNRPLGPGRAYACESLPLAQVRALSRQLETTLNDTMLAVIAGALRTLLLGRGEQVDRPLVASVPVSLDRAEQRLSGNRLGGLFVSLPVHVEDPVARCREAARAARHAKRERDALGGTLAEEWTGRIPPRLLRGYVRRGADRTELPKRLMINFGVSNVPGSPEPLELAGVRVAELWSAGSLHFDCGIQFSMWSYVDRLTVGVLTDSALLPDPHQVTDALRASYLATCEALLVDA